jgi:hypothetical protein
MRFLTTIVCLMTVVLVSGCGSAERDAARAQERAYEAQERVADERLKLVDQYQDCMKDAGGNHTKAAACESYLNAADALK